MKENGLVIPAVLGIIIVILLNNAPTLFSLNFGTSQDQLAILIVILVGILGYIAIKKMKG